MHEVVAVPQAGDASAARTIELLIGGMTCASCAARVEHKLAATGREVVASVNFATERATITAPQAVSAQTLVEAVEAAGYSAQIITSVGAGPRADHADHADDPSDPSHAYDRDPDGHDQASYLRRRLLLALIFF